MNQSEFDKLKKEIVAAIEFLQFRGYRVIDIEEMLKSIINTPKQWKLLYQYFSELECSVVNEQILKDVHLVFSDKVKAIFRYDNKLIEIIEPSNVDSYEKTYNHYKKKYTETIENVDLTKLLIDNDSDVRVAFKLGDRFEVFAKKSTVTDLVKVDIEDEVSSSLRSQYASIYGTKQIILPALNIIVFDTVKKVIIVGVDLANVVNIKLLNVKISSFKVDIKKQVKGIQFKANPINLFGKIKEFYDDKSDIINDMSFKTSDGVIHHTHANTRNPDARDSIYHKAGEKAVQGDLQVYRVMKKFKSSRNTFYSIDLKSIASMTTKVEPVLFKAIVNAGSSADLADALKKLL